MPLPTPGQTERRDDFIARCMRSLAGEFPKNDQRYAVCAKQWREKERSRGKKKAEG